MVLGTIRGSQSTMALSCSLAKSWVKLHYEKHEDGVVAKSVMYEHYQDYCREQDRNLMETSIFGRVVKNVFPDVTIRRLGGRLKLKYYYCGIRAKETSPYVMDNDTTTKPKRRLRKREVLTNKTEVKNCLRWLHSHFDVSNDSSVVKTEVYGSYLAYWESRAAETLSAQYFGMVVSHAFPNVTKRKLGPRTNQQKYYFGIQERIMPLSLELVSSDILSPSMEEALKRGSKSSYREVEDVEEDEEEDFSCQSPASDMSDMVAHSFHQYEASHIQYSFDTSLKCEMKPVDYSFSTLKLKDEPTEDDDITIKDEPLDLTGDASERRTPDRPPSVGNFVSNCSPSPPAKNSRSRKIYKPRFHYDSSWNEESTEDKSELSSILFFDECQSASALNNWLMYNLEESKGDHTNRDELFDFYEKHCVSCTVRSLPMTNFDETILKVFRGVVTMIFSSTITLYEGIRVKSSSPLFNKIQKLFLVEPHWPEEENSQHAMELSPEDESHSSPLSLEDEDDPPDESYSYSNHQIEEDMPQTTEVLQDGKYYLRKWLTDHFAYVPDTCVLKADAYRHYDIFAKSINQIPFEMNVFGKIVKQVFPDVTIRRLGGRLKPQYHYCGIAVKRTSPLCQELSGKDPAQRSRKKEIATDNHSAEIVIEFLHHNYYEAKDQSTLKNYVFENYSSYCRSICESPITLNYFGKLVKHCFPHVEVRKSGGRNEPTLFYFGMVQKATSSGYPQISSSQSFHDDPALKEVMEASFCESTRLSPAIMDIRHHHSTSPIPITMNRRIPNSANHYAESPPALLSASLIMATSSRNYEEIPHQVNSPIDANLYYRENIPSPAADIYYSRSPVESHTQGQHYAPIQVEFSRETFHHPHRLHLAGGQVVPSQTPPNVSSHISDQMMSLLGGTKPKRNIAVLEAYDYHDMGME